METPKHPRIVRSFVRREGRLTQGQQRALDEYMPRFGLQPAGRLDLGQAFGRDAPCHLEIGFGNGASLLAMAQAHPENDYLGIEVHRPGVGNLLLQVEKLGLTNIRVMCMDAVEVVRDHLADACLDAVYIFFPDPWHKTRHRKRRLVQPEFVALLRQRLKPGGLLHMATDWEDYARHMLAVMQQAEGFTNLAADGRYCERPAYRLLTKFEQRGLRLGHGVWDLLFRKND